MAQSESDLRLLRQSLQRALGGRPKSEAALFPYKGDARLLAAIRRIGTARGHRHIPHLTHGVMTFRLQGRNTPCPELKYACYAIARQVDWDGRRLIDDPRQVADLLAAVAALPARPEGSRQFRDCCRALRVAWQEGAQERAADDADGWRTLGEFLRTAAEGAPSGR